MSQPAGSTPIMSFDRFAEETRREIGRLTDMQDAWQAALRDADVPARRGQPQRRTSGTHSDPTGTTAVEILERLERAQHEWGLVVESLRHIAGLLSTWMPPEDFDAGVRRCGREDCARQHYAKGECEKHYRQSQRAGAA